MTISLGNSFPVQYAGNGTAVTFSYPWKISAQTDLIVGFIAGGNYTQQISGYTVAGVGNNGGGAITFTAAPPLGTTVDLRPLTPALQGTEFANLAAYLPESTTNTLDRVVRMLQDLTRLTYTFGIHGPDQESLAWPTLPSASIRANTGLVFDENGLPNVGILTSSPLTQALFNSFLGSTPTPTNTIALGSAANAFSNVYLGPNGATAFDPVSGNIGFYARTATETALSVMPVNYAYAPGHVWRYGAIGNGITDDWIAFANAALVCGTHPMLVPYTQAYYKIGTPFQLPANATMIGYGEGRPKLVATTNGVEICSALSVGGEITVKNILFAGTSSSTTPVNNPTGLGATATALLNITGCADVRIENCEFSTFYNGVCVALCNRVWIEDNRVSTFLYTGILAPQTSNFVIEGNDISNCTQIGAAVAYGIQCSGNFPTHTSQYNSISFNRIIGVPSWDGIGTHDIDGLRVIGNDIRNVRHGIDIGHLVNTNQVQNIIVQGNYIEGTGVDTYSGAGQEIGDIIIAGFDATHRVLGVNISGNQIRGFFNVTGMVGAGNGAGCICVTNTDDANITGNIISGGGFGNTPQSTGIFIQGTVNRLTICGNSVQGQSYPRGGIRLQNVISDVVSITGNSGIQSSTANNHILITGSTLGLLTENNNPSNSIVPVSIVTSTYTMSGREASRVPVTVPYSTSMVFEASLGNQFEITATDGVAFSISNPTDPVFGQRITLRIINASGGVLGAVTFGTKYKMSTWTQPAAGFNRSVDLEYNGTNWYQVGQTGVDIPN